MTKKFEPTEAQRKDVLKRAGNLDTDEDIAACIGISEQTLRKYFRVELDQGRAGARSFARGKIKDAILAGEVGALIFYLKTQCGWREKEHIAQPGNTTIILQQGEKPARLLTGEVVKTGTED